MWLDDLSYDEWAEWGREWWAEQPSEQQREKAAAALAGIKRTRKDESKASRDNDFLRKILLEIISSGKYDPLLSSVLTLLETNVPSNLIVGGFSLVYTPASDLIRQHYTAHMTDEIRLVRFDYTPGEGVVPFDENSIDPAVRSRINEWIDDMFSVVSYDPSALMTERSIGLLSGHARSDIVSFFAGVLTFFLRAVNIEMSDKHASHYADFIAGELRKKLAGLPIEKI